jgi:hypothetical protein
VGSLRSLSIRFLRCFPAWPPGLPVGGRLRQAGPMESR